MPLGRTTLWYQKHPSRRSPRWTLGAPVSSDIFADYDATIVNFWNNGCGTCIEEMPELEELYHPVSYTHLDVYKRQA